MNIKFLGIALIAAGFASVASARTRTDYDARFLSIGGGQVELDGFGRGATNIRAATSGRMSSFSTLAARVNFFDTWNIDTSGIAPGTYNFDNWVIDAKGSLLFGTSGFSVGLNYIDESGVRFTEFFEVNALGTKAVGSGTFTVRQQCPIASCIWLDILGSQAVGGGAAGYGGTGALVASVVPEPATYGLMALGLLVVGAAARRRRADA